MKFLHGQAWTGKAWYCTWTHLHMLFCKHVWYVACLKDWCASPFIPDFILFCTLNHTYLLPLWNALSLYIYFFLAFLLSYCSFLFSCTWRQLNTPNHCLRKVLQVFLLFIMEQEIEQTLICISILWHQFLLNLCLPSVFIGCFDPAYHYRSFETNAVSKLVSAIFHYF